MGRGVMKVYSFHGTRVYWGIPTDFANEISVGTELDVRYVESSLTYRSVQSGNKWSNYDTIYISIVKIQY